MNPDDGRITVYYDGACPSCVRDRHAYEKLSGRAGRNVVWFDITGQDERLREMGIDPLKALTALHIKTANEQILSEIDADTVLMRQVPLLRPLGWLIGLPLIHPIIAKIDHRRVNDRLKRSGRP